MGEMQTRMIPKWTRQCPKRGGEPVGTEEVCKKCGYYDPDPLHKPCGCHDTAVDVNARIERLRDMLGGNEDWL